ncbi:LOW QUALITY PROTEIN: hypothetical protein TorRG33x02_094970 [Trema orientale]|uniref:Uncharacterized protein n=1 Tax=Trema orientale TaxID=63057 RepID=A0A2P5FA96_TREOI|nr:LOW QUALITY PROTEIN: hypothetical protein TorRG33x02_094970 [Trema orientale]
MENYLLRVGMGFGFGLGLLSRRSHFLRDFLRERAGKLSEIHIQSKVFDNYRASNFIFLPFSFLFFKSFFRLGWSGGGKCCACDKYNAQWGGRWPTVASI